MREKTGGKNIYTYTTVPKDDPIYPRQNFLGYYRSKNNIMNATTNLFENLPHQFVPEEEANQNKEEDAKTEKKRHKKIRALAAKVRKDLSHLPQGWGGKKSRNKRFRTKRKSKRRYR